MPKRRANKKTLNGSGVTDILKGVNKFLKQNKVLSKGAPVLASVLPSKYKNKVLLAGQVAKQLGYGSGGSLRLAGQGKKKAGRPRRVGRPCKK